MKLVWVNGYKFRYKSLVGNDVPPLVPQWLYDIIVRIRPDRRQIEANRDNTSRTRIQTRSNETDR